jgi:small-conductance mechanosensitive channel
MIEWFTINNLFIILSIIIFIIIIFIFDKLVRRAIIKYSIKTGLEKHVENIFKLVARVVIVAVGIAVLLSVLGLPTDWFVGVSALSGAAIGFASTQTVGNFLAGLYIMISKPFMVNDYVKIGDVEGEVREITINYTKIYTPNYDITEIPNRRVLDSIISNYSGKKNIIDYSFKVGFPHEGTNKEIIERCIKPAINDFYKKYKEILPKKPEYSMYDMDRLGRGFFIRIFFPERKIDTFYDVQPELMQKIVNNWDKYKQTL